MWWNRWYQKCFSGLSRSSASVNSGPSHRSTGVSRSARIHACAAPAGSARPLRSTTASGCSGSGEIHCTASPRSVVNRARSPSASAKVSRTASASAVCSSGPVISTYSAVL